MISFAHNSIWCPYFRDIFLEGSTVLTYLPLVLMTCTSVANKFSIETDNSVQNTVILTVEMHRR